MCARIARTRGALEEEEEGRRTPGCPSGEACGAQRRIEPRLEARIVLEVVGPGRDRLVGVADGVCTRARIVWHQRVNLGRRRRDGAEQGMGGVYEWR